MPYNTLPAKSSEFRRWEAPVAIAGIRHATVAFALLLILTLAVPARAQGGARPRGCRVWVIQAPMATSTPSR